MLTPGIEIGAGWVRTSEASGKDYVSLSLAAPEFGPRKLYANLDRAAGPGRKTLSPSFGTPTRENTRIIEAALNETGGNSSSPLVP